MGPPAGLLTRPDSRAIADWLDGNLDEMKERAATWVPPREPTKTMGERSSAR